jgi:superfamily I DNA/RNA helicase
MFYVAMTRAKDSLNISYLTEKKKEPSRFVEELLNCRVFGEAKESEQDRQLPLPISS